jgi:hypothetical protein
MGVHRRVIGLASCVLLLAAEALACTGKVSEGGCTGGDRNGPYKLDLANQSVTQAIGPEIGDAAAQKFVQVEVAAVVNPKLIPMTFDVHYRPEKGDQTLLGTFALYPPDKPGRFIVPTSGRLRSNGAIVLSMTALQKTGPEDEVRVEVRRICFRRK